MKSTEEKLQQKIEREGREKEVSTDDFACASVLSCLFLDISECLELLLFFSTWKTIMGVA